MNEDQLPMDLADRAGEFWAWFRGHEADIAGLLRDSPDKSFATEITRRVSALCEGLGWEAGPGNGRENQFVISPNRDRRRLRVTREIVRLAPALPGWSFLPVKPPKSWNFEMEIVEHGRHVRVSVRDWRYSLTGFDGNAFFDVDLFPDRLRDIDEGTYQSLGVLIVESEIGEELLIEKVDRITVRAEAPASRVRDLTPITYLYQHLLDLSR